MTHLLLFCCRLSVRSQVVHHSLSLHNTFGIDLIQLSWKACSISLEIILRKPLHRSQLSSSGILGHPTAAMKLDATDLRYVTSDEFRVLTAVSRIDVAEFADRLTGSQVEMGSKNHEIVPTVLIVKISGLRNGGVNKILGSLAKRNLVSRVQNARCAFLHYPANSVLRLRSLAALSYNRRRIPAHLWRV